ncbi:hypothetical protein ACIBW9_35220 [Streptomyces sp. NPDC049541]
MVEDMPRDESVATKVTTGLLRRPTSRSGRWAMTSVQVLL